MAPPMSAALATGTPAKKAIASPMQDHHRLEYLARQHAAAIDFGAEFGLARELGAIDDAHDDDDGDEAE